MSGSVNTTTQRRAGIASLTINGTAYDVQGDLAYLPSTVKRETLLGQSGVQGFSEMPAAPYISATIRDAGSLTVQDFNQMTSVSVVLILANGKTIYGDGMWNTECEEVKTQEGTFTVKFEGYDVTEVTN